MPQPVGGFGLGALPFLTVILVRPEPLEDWPEALSASTVALRDSLPLAERGALSVAE